MNPWLETILGSTLSYSRRILITSYKLLSRMNKHHIFLKHPTGFHREKMCNFGAKYISLDDYFEIAGYLLNKFFWCKKGLFSVN